MGYKKFLELEVSWLSRPTKIIKDNGLFYFFNHFRKVTTGRIFYKCYYIYSPFTDTLLIKSVIVDFLIHKTEPNPISREKVLSDFMNCLNDKMSTKIKYIEERRNLLHDFDI